MYRKSPVKTIRQTKIIARASEISRNEINPSTTEVPSFPPAIGIIFPAPVMAAIDTATKFAKEPYRVNQNAKVNHLLFDTSLFQISPRITNNIPFIMPSRWAESPILGFVIIGINNPMSNPNKNKRIPRMRSLSDCHFLCPALAILILL